MSQYLFKGNVNNLGNQIIGIGTAFLANVQPGSWVSRRGSSISYLVTGVPDDTHLNIQGVYGGATEANVDFWAGTSRTTNHNFPYPEMNDVDTPALVKQAFIMLDNKLGNAIGSPANANRILFTDASGNLTTSGNATLTSAGNMALAGTANFTGLVTMAGSATIATTAAGTYFRVTEAGGGDGLRVLGLTAGSGVTVDGVNNANSAYRPLTVGGSTASIHISGAPKLSIDASGNTSVAGAFSATGIITSNATNGILNATAATTNAKFIRLSSTGGDFYFGTESSVAGGFFTGASAYASVLYSQGTTPIEMIVAGVKTLSATTTNVFSTKPIAMGVATSVARPFYTHTEGTLTNAAGMFNGSAHNTVHLGSYFDTVQTQGIISIGFVGDDRGFHIGKASGSDFTTATFTPKFSLSGNGRVNVIDDLRITGSGSTLGGSGQAVELTNNYIQCYNRTSGNYADLTYYAASHMFYASVANANAVKFTTGGFIKQSNSGAYISGTATNNEMSAIGLGATNTVLQLFNNATSGDNILTSFHTDGGATLRGSITYNRAGGLTAYNTTSDRRSKYLYGRYDLSEARNTIANLQVHLGIMHGATLPRPMFVADEAQNDVPYAVTGQPWDSERQQQMDHQIIVPLLTAGIQDLQHQVNELRAAVNDIQIKIAA